MWNNLLYIPIFSGYCQRRPKTLRLRLIALWPNANVTIQTNPRRKKESACCGHTPGVEMLQFLGTFPFLNMSFATPLLCDSFHTILKDYWIIRFILLCRQDWSDDLHGYDDIIHLISSFSSREHDLFSSEEGGCYSMLQQQLGAEPGQCHAQRPVVGRWPCHIWGVQTTIPQYIYT